MHLTPTSDPPAPERELAARLAELDESGTAGAADLNALQRQAIPRVPGDGTRHAAMTLLCHMAKFLLEPNAETRENRDVHDASRGFVRRFKSRTIGRRIRATRTMGVFRCPWSKVDGKCW
jgi:hypothetical protein